MRSWSRLERVGAENVERKEEENEEEGKEAGNEEEGKEAGNEEEGKAEEEREENEAEVKGAVEMNGATGVYGGAGVNDARGEEKEASISSIFSLNWHSCNTILWVSFR